MPAMHDGCSLGFYSANSLRCIKQRLEDGINKDRQGDRISFNLRTFRDTYCQMNIDLNPANLPRSRR